MSQFVLNNGPETRRSNSSCNIYDLAAVIVHHGNGYVAVCVCVWMCAYIYRIFQQFS